MKDSDKNIVDRIVTLRNYFLKNSEINNSFTPEYIIADKITHLINKKETLIIDDFYFIINTFNNITSEKHYDGSAWQDFQMQIINFLNNNGIEVIVNSTGGLIIKFITTNLDLQNKDDSIKKLIEYLSEKYGRNDFKIKDYWEADLCAIGLTDLSEKYLIYISTISLDESGYFVSLENPPTNDEFPYDPAGEFDKLSLSELERIFKEHLRIE